MPFLAIVYVRDADDAHTLVNELPAGRLAGLYRMPAKDVKLCRVGCRHEGWSRHIPGGWMKHGCGLRNRKWWKNLAGIFLDTFGINLLKRDDTPRLFRNPEGWDLPENLSVFGPSLHQLQKRPHSSEDE